MTSSAPYHARVVFLRCAVIACFLSPAIYADTQITLKNSFIEKYKNRATITATYTVDAAHKKPNPASKDGDMHIAGRAREAGDVGALGAAETHLRAGLIKLFAVAENYPKLRGNENFQ